ncbi:hypothetical protein PCE1_003731 [Barthelona sp. PCE]
MSTNQYEMIGYPPATNSDFETAECNFGSDISFKLFYDNEWQLQMKNKATEATVQTSVEISAMLCDDINHRVTCSEKFVIISIVRETDTVICVFNYDKTSVEMIGELFIIESVCTCSVFDKTLGVVSANNKSELITYMILSNGSIVDEVINPLPFEVDSFTLCANDWILASINSDGLSIGLFNTVSDKQAVLPYELKEYKPNHQPSANSVSVEILENGEKDEVTFLFPSSSSYSMSMGDAPFELCANTDGEKVSKIDLKKKCLWTLLHYPFTIFAILFCAKRSFVYSRLNDYGSSIRRSNIDKHTSKYLGISILNVIVSLLSLSNNYIIWLVIFLYRIIEVYFFYLYYSEYYNFRLSRLQTEMLFFRRVWWFYSLVTSFMAFLNLLKLKKGKSLCSSGLKKIKKKYGEACYNIYFITMLISAVVVGNIVLARINDDRAWKYASKYSDVYIEMIFLVLFFIVFVIAAIILMVRSFSKKNTGEIKRKKLIKSWKLAIVSQIFVNAALIYFSLNLHYQFFNFLSVDYVKGVHVQFFIYIFFNTFFMYLAYDYFLKNKTQMQ